MPQHHSWSEKVAYEHHSDRVCWNCELIKRTRHEGHLHWIEWWRGNVRVEPAKTQLGYAKTPPCEKPQVRR
jgi:hypothetical protein